MSENVSFEDVLDALMLEELTPSYQALLRWSQRYPQYRNELAEFFATWGVQAAEMPDEVPIEEEKLVERGVNYALEILRRQARIVPRDAVQSLEPFDQLVLAAIYLLHGEGYSVNITRKVSEMSGVQVLPGTTFLSLKRLEDQGLISPWLSDPETEPDGKSRRHFTITLAGERALAYAKETSKVVADFLGDLA